MNYSHYLRYALLSILLLPTTYLFANEEVPSDLADELVVVEEPERLKPDEPYFEEDLSPVDIEPLFSLFSAGNNQNSYLPEVEQDPFKHLKGWSGELNVDQFTGGAGYSYPISLPSGRLGIQPNVFLQYSTHDQRYASPYGFGWNLPFNGIFRSTEQGKDQLYSDDSFTANILGQSMELIVVDGTNNLYMPRYEGSGGFTKFEKQTDKWFATDTKGTTYLFGLQASAQQQDPNDSTRVFSWMLERVEDRFGNFMTFTYIKDQGQIYPANIRYTGNGNDEGIYEVRFVYENQLPYSEYERGFKVTTGKRLKSIELHNYATGSAILSQSWELEYDERSNAFLFLNSITQKGANGVGLPPTAFTYYDGSESNRQYKRLGLLKTIRTSHGAEQELIYKTSSSYRNGAGLQNKIPFIVATLAETRTKAGPNEPEAITTYDYSGGHYYFDSADAFKKEYTGFEKVVTTDPYGNNTTRWYHQSEFSTDRSGQGEHADHLSKKGRVYREEIRDLQGDLWQTVLTKWGHQALSDENPKKDRYFVAVDQSVTIHSDGDNDEKVKAESYQYDSYGNVAETIDWGEVSLVDQTGFFTDIENDKLKTTTAYAQNVVNNIYSYPSETIAYDINDQIIGRQKQYYDGLIHGQIDKGSWTKTEDFIDTTNVITKRTEYNMKGQPVRVINGRNYATDFGYDTHDLYVNIVTNPKGHIQTYDYDYRWGVPRIVTDANNMDTERVFDVFGRVVEVKQTDPSNIAQQNTITEYVYQDSQYPTSLKETKWLSGTTKQERIQYQDGLVRPIQTKALLDGQWVKTDTLYDLRGNKAQQNLPVFTTGEAYETVDANGAGTSLTYDPLNRSNTATNVLGVTTTVYDQWSQTVTDPNGNQKTLHHDARNQLIQVDENLGGTVHSTEYSYSPLGYMLSVTDPLGNKRSNTYDFLGQMLTEEDLHSPVDTTFSITTYTYDAEGNMETKISPNGDVLTYVYDALNRPMSETINSSSNPSVVYNYDQGSYAKGRVDSVVSLGGSKTFVYDIRGRVTNVDHIIDGTTFSLQQQYDNQNNILSLTYPDATVVTYMYEPSGSLQQVLVDGGGAVTDITYAPTGINKSITLSNGVTTSDTFDINKLYRLTKRESVNSTGDKLQDVNYLYDSVGNIMQINDVSQTNAAKVSDFEYDDLYRLTKATITSSANTDDYIRTYAYDIVGNITSTSENGAYVYAGNNPSTAQATNAHPHAVTSANGKSYIYDDNGNLTSNGTWIHTWDEKDRLMSSTDGTKTIQYTYDEAKDRLMKNNTTTEKKTYYVDKYYDLEETTGKAHIYVGTRKIGTKETDTTQ